MIYTSFFLLLHAYGLDCLYISISFGTTTVLLTLGDKICLKSKSIEENADHFILSWLPRSLFLALTSNLLRLNTCWVVRIYSSVYCHQWSHSLTDWLTDWLRGRSRCEPILHACKCISGISFGDADETSRFSIDNRSPKRSPCVVRRESTSSLRQMSYL